MENQSNLTEDQTTRIAATLKRIRAGLKKKSKPICAEPAHLFNPEAADDGK